MSVNTRYLYFDVKNHTGSLELTGYALPNTPFTFLPYLDDPSGTFSNSKLLWDFGDGSFSRELTGTHYYKQPGQYEVSLYLTDNTGNGYVDSFKQTITVKNFISDTISLCGSSDYVNFNNYYQNPFNVVIFNSWQSYNALSSVGYTASFNASGTNAPLIDADTYNKDKYAHLKPFSKFYKRVYNYITGLYDYEVISNTKIDVTEIYCTLSANNVYLCDKNETGATFAGTSGEQLIFFVDDLPCSGTNFSQYRASIIFATRSYAGFKDLDLAQRNYVDALHYNILNQTSNTIFYTTVSQLSVAKLSITSNGLDGDNTQNSLFDIDVNKFVGTKIPFTVRIKDVNNYSSKQFPLLSAINYNSPLSANTVKIGVLSGTTLLPVTAVATFNGISGESYGGYFNGYILPLSTYNNIALSAIALVQTQGQILAATPIAWLSQPESKYLHKLNVTTSYDYCGSSIAINVGVNDTLTNTTSLTGVNAFAVVPENNNGSNYSTWLVDSDNDVVAKYNVFGTQLSSINLSAFALQSVLSSAAPSCVAIDSNLNVWVTLFDAVSTLKISNTTGAVLAAAVPTLTNTDWSLSSTYLSGFGGGNSLTPSCVDTDSSNNIWVSYSHPLSSYLMKYSTNGILLSTISLSALWSADSLYIDPNDRVWVVYKDYLTASTVLADKNDKVLVVGTTGSVSTINVGGSLGDITSSVDESVWVTKNKNIVVKINPQTFATVEYYTTTSTENTSDSISDLTGIAGTASNQLLIVNSPSHTMFTINLNTSFLAITGENDILQVSDVTPVTSVGSTNDGLRSYGDWTGFRWVQKYVSVSDSTFVITGSSALFNVYPETGHLKVAKINENIDMSEIFKSNSFQDVLMNKPRLYDDFLGTIVGNISSNANTLGKKTYEKISNFVDNNNYIDTCNVNALVSLNQMIGEDISQFSSYNFIYPANISRIVDIASIKQSILWGDRNKYNENYDKRGLQYSTKYGINLGDPLNFNTAILSAGAASASIVAYEKFSNTYSLLNTNLLSSTNVHIWPNNTYPLSSYNANWGWGLVLPDNFTITDINQLYTFYTYASTYENSQIEGIINWADSLNTISESNYTKTYWESAIQSMLTYEFTKGLNLFTSAFNADY